MTATSKTRDGSMLIHRAGGQDAVEVIKVRARTSGRAVACPGCGAEAACVHGYCERTVADVPAAGGRSPRGRTKRGNTREMPARPIPRLRIVTSEVRQSP
jgi:hypothetical protein